MDDQPAAVGVTNVPLNAFAGGRQTISGLDDGTYSLQFFAKGEGRGYVEANGRKTALTASPNVLAKGFVRGGKAERVCPPRASDVDPHGQNKNDSLRQNKIDP